MDEFYVKIPNDFGVPPGSQLMLYAEWATKWPYGRAVQWAAIEEALKQKHPNFDVISYQDQPDYLRIEVKVTGPSDEDVQMQRATLVTGLVLAAKLLLIGVTIFSAGWAITNITTYWKAVEETKQIEAQRDIVLAGGEVPAQQPAGTAAVMQQAGIAGSKLAVAAIVLILIWRFAK